MKNEVLLCDCNDFMAECPDGLYDLAIVDPPYGIGYENGGQYFNDHKGKKWDKKPGPIYFKELFRVSKNQIIWGGNYFNLPSKRGIIAWTKTKEMQGRTFSEWEMAWTSFDERAKWINLKPFIRNGKRIHPTQKPVALYKWLLTNYAKPGWTIFDSHVGSGSIRIACHDLGFDFTGCELDPDYHAAQEERYRAYVAANPRLPGIETADRQIFEQGEL